MSEHTQDDSILDIFLLGIKTWLAEITWLGKSLLGRYEVSRLEKELDREYGILGHITEKPQGKKDAKELCLKQIAFLKEEIETLKSELAADREERMKNLRPQSKG